MIIKKQQYITISMFIALMISAIVIVDLSWINGYEEANLKFEKQGFSPSIPTEQGVFKRSEHAAKYENMPEDVNSNRSLVNYYKRRAYPGAPPIIPHDLLTDQGIGGKDCLQCHENGGYVAQLKAYTPITPHPEMINCKQCHVAPKTNKLFVASNWTKIKSPDIHNAAMAGSPPVIPHTLQMRENCVSCHAGPAAPSAIKVSHPMRINCRQCHVAVKDLSKVSIQWDSLNQFIRKPK